MSDLDARHERLRASLREMQRVVIAYSGGVDSTLLLRVAVEVLGERAVGLCALSPSFAPWELEDARREAAAMGARVIEIESREYERDGYRQNAGDRCYHCKSELFDLAALEATAQDLGQLCYGAIPEDLGDHRPGMRAAAEHGVRAPLIEAGLSKVDIRALSRRYGLGTADKPAAACLSSRFPYGTEVTPERLSQVARCEAALRNLGLLELRARFHGDLVRLELGSSELSRVFAEASLRDCVTEACRAAGFKFVSVDLDGYRSGSANAGLVQIHDASRSFRPNLTT